MSPLKKVVSALLIIALSCSFPTAFADNDRSEVNAVTEEADDNKISVLDEEEFTDIVNFLLEQYGLDTDKFNSISVGFCYTKTDETAYYYGDEWYYTASLYKLPLMMMVANDVLNDKCPLGGYDGGAEKVMEKCLVYSDNTRAMYVEKVYTSAAARENERKLAGWTEEELPEGFLKRTGDKRYSCRFMTDILRELYANPDEYPNVIDYMTQANPGEFLRQNDLEDIVIAQKYGSSKYTDGWVNHIAGIVYSDTPILITVMTDRLGYNLAKSFCGKLCTLLVDYSAELDQRYEDKAAEIEREKQQALEEAERLEKEACLEQQAKLAQEQEEAKALAEREAAEKARGKKKTCIIAGAGAAVLLAGSALTVIAVRKKRAVDTAE